MKEQTVEMVQVIISGVVYWFNSIEEAKEFKKQMMEQ